MRQRLLSYSQTFFLLSALLQGMALLNGCSTAERYLEHKHRELEVAVTVPEDALEMYAEEAPASYYGKEFHGRKTSTGERFDRLGYTCAHKVLPFDTIIKVTNLSNGKSVLVRVNDRMPQRSKREIDLSEQAARDIGMIAQGTAMVRIEIVKHPPATPDK